MPDRDGMSTKDRKIHGDKNAWSAAQRQKKIYGFYVHVGFERHHRSVGYGSVRWYGHGLRREDGHVLKMALDLEVEGQRKKWRQKRTRKRQDEEERVKVGLRREDALCRSKWIVDINQIVAGLR